MAVKALPTKEALVAAMKIAETSVEAAEYLGMRFKEIVTESKMADQLQDVVEKVDEFIEIVKFKLNSTAEVWSGEQSNPSDFKNMQDNMAIAAIEKLIGETQGEVNLDVAVSDESELIRAYSANGELLTENQVSELDTLFNAWLAKNNIVTKGSILYQANEEGELLKDKQGSPIKASSEKVKQLMNHAQQGFVNFLKEKGVALKIQQHEYPTEPTVEVEAEKPQA